MTTAIQSAATRKVNWFAVYSDASGLSIPLRGLKMRRFNIFSIYRLGASLAPLKLLGWLELEAAQEVLSAARLQLKSLREQNPASLEILELPAGAIDANISLGQRLLAKTGHVIGEEENLLIKSVTEFETILKAQTPTEHTYMIEQLRGYSMPILVDGADQNFSSQTRSAIGEEIKKDIKEAGRCLAFELPTAAGIHMMRAFDKVLRKFYTACTGKQPGHRDIWHLLARLRKLPNVEPKVLNVLDQIRDLHRNPLAHEVFLEMDEAVDLFDIAKSAITAMARKL